MYASLALLDNVCFNRQYGSEPLKVVPPLDYRLRKFGWKFKKLSFNIFCVAQGAIFITC